MRDPSSPTASRDDMWPLRAVDYSRPRRRASVAKNCVAESCRGGGAFVAGAITGLLYEPFGNSSFSGPASGNSFQYTGRENDGTGVYYYRARYYDPQIGTLISEDPAGFVGGINMYCIHAKRPDQPR